MRKSSLIALSILGGMLFLMIMSTWKDSATFDEVAHIGAGYSYLTQKDGRLNPEHPPLVKSFSALPLLFLKLNFSVNQPFWTLENVNDRQWAAGNYLLYEAENNADKILFWARSPIMILAILFGWIFFGWVRKSYGVGVALLSLLFFALSPTFLAHSRFVTTDLGAAFAFFLSTIFFIEFLKKNNKQSLIYFGIIFGFSLLVKFSLVILLPFFVLVGIISSFRPHPWGMMFIGKFILACIIAVAVIYIFYIPQTWNYPLEQNLADAHYTLGQYKTAQFAPKIDFWLLSHEITRPLGQYLHGFLMAAQRTAGGNSAYFLGEISSNGWISYFPVLFFTKEQIGLYVLMLLSLVIAIKQRKAIDKKTLVFLTFIVYYWAWSLWSPLNIGIRHILPTFPFIYVLISKSIIEWAQKNFFKNAFIFAVILWMAFEIIFTFPYFISYYNMFVGGIKNGYKIATDSNFDWGQDLRRLKNWTEENKINKIYVDYFGGGSLKYYFGDKAEPWRHEKGPPLIQNGVKEPVYFAISANSLVGAEKLYFWLQGKQPIAIIGSSIFVFSL